MWSSIGKISCDITNIPKSTVCDQFEKGRASYDAQDLDARESLMLMTTVSWALIIQIGQDNNLPMNVQEEDHPMCRNGPLVEYFKCVPQKTLLMTDEHKLRRKD